MKTARYILSCICLLTALLMTSCSGRKARPKIVLFTSFPETSLSYDRIRKDLLHEYDASKYDVAIASAVINDSTNVDESIDIRTVRLQIESCLDTMVRKPDAIIYFGDLIAHSAASSQQRIIRNTPAVCLHITYPEYKGLLQRRSNFVVYQYPLSIQENMDFIYNTKDNAAVAIQLDSSYLDNHTFKILLDILNKDKRRITELHSQWSQVHEPVLHYLRMSNECFRVNGMDDNMGMYYTVSPEVFNLKYVAAMNGCLGGYLSPTWEMLKQAHPTVDALLEGTQPQSIRWQKHHCDYWLDWRVAQQIHPYASDFPRYTHFVNLPWRYTSRLHMLCYWMLMPLCILLLVLAIILIPMGYSLKYYLQRRKLHREGKYAKETYSQVQNILDSIGAYLFHITEDYYVVLQQSSAESDIRNRRLSLAAVLRLLDEHASAELRNFIENKTDAQELQIEATYSSRNHQEQHSILIQISKHQQSDSAYICSGLYFINDDEHTIDAELKEAFRRSEELTAKESFLAAMGHEIRTPLNAIAGFAQVLLQHNQDLSDEERATYGEYIVQSNNELLRLMDKVMNYSRANGDHFHIELNRHNVTNLLENLYVIHSVIVPKNLTFNLQRGPSGIEFKVNRTSLYQIVSNLINNAIKFTEQGSITLGWEVVDTEKSDEKTDALKYVIIFVQDTGVGIAPELQKRIFERYFKQNNHTVGAGIGLSLCKELATQMGGTILVKSELGKGSRFEIILPLLSDSI